MASRETETSPRFGKESDERAPERPTALGRRSWGGVLKRTFKGFKADNLTDWGAALTYYGVLSIFPALLVVVSILGLIGTSATQPLIDNLGKVAPGPAQQIFTNAIDGLQKSQGSAGVVFFVGLAAALWSASGYVSAFSRASNAIYGVGEGRPFYLLRPLQVLITLVLVIMLAISAVAVVVTGPLANQVGNVIGAGSTAVTVWDIAKWPVLMLMVGTMFSILYFTAPNVRHPASAGSRPGGLVARVRVDRGLGRRSRSTSRTSAPTTRPTARSAGSSPSWSGCGSPTSPSCSGPSSTPSSSAAAARGRRARPRRSVRHAARGSRLTSRRTASGASRTITTTRSPCTARMNVVFAPAPNASARTA